MSLLGDPFDSMAINTNAPPTGWAAAGNGGFCFDYSHVAPFSNIGGLWPGHNYWWSEGTDVITHIFGPATNASIFSGYQLLSNNNTPVVPLFSVLCQANGAAGQQKNFNNDYTWDILDVRIEQDMTLSLYTPGSTGISGVFLDNSGNPANGLKEGGAFPLNTWYYIDLEVQTAFQIYNGINYIYVTAQLYVDGTKVCDSGNAPPSSGGSVPPGITGIPQALLAVTFSPAFCYVQYHNPGSANYCLSQYDIESGTNGGVPPALTTLPSQSTPNLVPLQSNVRVSQMPAEFAELVYNPNVRISQLPIEVSQRPYTPNVRISQLVIELAKQAAPPIPGGWQVKEA